MNSMMIRSYRQLSRLETFEERFDYLKLGSQVGSTTFGFDRWLNQQFYRSVEWEHIRSAVIARDLGCDLGVMGYEISTEILVHHINPLLPQDIQEGSDLLLDLDNLITTTRRTHNAIHFGDRSLLARQLVVRRPGDTNLW